MGTFSYSIVDLTHTLDENAPTWDGQCGFKQEITNDYGSIAQFVPFPFRVQQISLRSGMGTHLDTPAHYSEGGLTIDQLALTNLVGPCFVIDVSANTHERSSVSLEDVENFEKQYGVIPKGSIVMIRTGWDKFWDQPENYRNNNLFPSVSAKAAEHLLQRNIAGLGVDTPSPDRPEDGYPVHAILLEAQKYILENVTNLQSLPPSGSFAMCLPLKTRNGTEGPVRLIGLLNK